jgi:hypothetical protein
VVTIYHGTDHGTDEHSATRIAMAAHPLPHRVMLNAGKALVDFGRGFYTTTSEHQARNWANLRIGRCLGPRGRAAVLHFEVDREALAGLADLVFPRETTDF